MPRGNNYRSCCIFGIQRVGADGGGIIHHFNVLMGRDWGRLIIIVAVGIKEDHVSSTALQKFKIDKIVSF